MKHTTTLVVFIIAFFIGLVLAPYAILEML